jgi:hypothetical protein
MYVDAIRGFKIVEAFFGLPGVFVAVIAAMLFSPQGFHGGDQFVWVIFPANLIIYFVFLTMWFSKTPRESQTTGGPVS